MEDIRISLIYGASLGVIIAVIVIIIALVLYFVLLPRLAPGLVAKRKLKQEQSFERSQVKSRRKREAEEQRMKQWALAHPNHPLAKDYLERNAPPPAPDEDDGQPESSEFDPGDELRQRHEEEQRYKDMRQEEDRIIQQLFEWSLENPSSPDAQWFLKKRLDLELTELKWASTRVKSLESMLRWITPGDLEEVLCRGELDEAQTRLKSVHGVVRDIQIALGEPVLDDISR